MITIRRETPSDYNAVYNLVQSAFAGADHADGTEQDLVVRLRKSVAFVPALSLVAEADGALVGHILFTGLGLGGIPAVGLAPLAVAPGCQGRGIGRLLMEEGHGVARGLGYTASVVLGHPGYYPRAGYRDAAEFGIQCPFEGVPQGSFMALDLQGGGFWAGCAPEYPREFEEGSGTE